MKAQSPETVVFRIIELLPIALLLFAVSTVNAAPTISNCNRNIFNCAVTPSSDAHTHVVPKVTRITEYGDSPLTAVAAEFIKPPASFTDLTVSSPIHIKSLPAVPGALFMVLTGFLCVSLVKDRRVWFVAWAGLLSAGHAGIRAVPPLAHHLCHRTHTKQHLAAKSGQFYLLESIAQRRSDIEETRYIGLLQHLVGIPDADNTLTNNCLAKLATFDQHHQKLYGEPFRYPHKNTFPPLSAIIQKQHSLNSLSKCLVSRTEQFTCFSPAFIFENLPRGPPILT